MLKIDFGSGYNPYPGYKTCDITQGPYLDYVYNTETNEIIGLQEGSVDEFRLKNVLHHADIPKVIQCLHRYLKSGGILQIIEPRTEYYEQNRSLDLFWYRYIYPRYDIAIPPKRRVDYLKICEAYFKISSHQNADVYDVYFFVNR